MPAPTARRFSRIRITKEMYNHFPHPASGTVSRFKAGAKECLDKTVGGKKTDAADACTCWTNSTLNQTVEAAKVNPTIFCSFSLN